MDFYANMDICIYLEAERCITLSHLFQTKMEFEQNCFKCKSVDFLLFNCLKCLHKYCQTHRFPSLHDCIEEVEVERVAVEPLQKQKCSLDSCDQVDILISTCRHCSQVYCLKHRHQPDHDCSRLVNITIIKQVDKPKIDLKLKKTNPKLELMRLKLNGKGDSQIPMSNRVYMTIIEGSTKSNLFFNQNTIIGRLVDILASRSKIVNNNNLGGVRIALFNGTDGKVLEMSKTLQDLITSNVIYNGSTLILKQSDDDRIDV